MTSFRMIPQHPCPHCREMIDMLSRDPGFYAYTPAYTLHAIRDAATREPERRVCVISFDLDDLKQLNAATGDQVRTDELINPALIVRGSDVLIGKSDGGDGFFVICPRGDGLGLVERMRATLARAPLTPEERARFMEERTQKHGARPARDYPTATFRIYPDVALRDVEQLFLEASSGLLSAKANGQRGHVVGGRA